MSLFCIFLLRCSSESFLKLFRRVRLPWLAVKAHVDRVMCRIQYWHPDLVYNGAGCPVACSKVGLIHGKISATSGFIDDRFVLGCVEGNSRSLLEAMVW